MKLPTHRYTPEVLKQLKKEQPRQFLALRERVRRELINHCIRSQNTHKTPIFDPTKVSLAFGQGDGQVTPEMKQHLFRAAERENRQGQALSVYSFV